LKGWKSGESVFKRKSLLYGNALVNLHNDDNRLFISAKNGSSTSPSEKGEGLGFILNRLDHKSKRKKNDYIFAFT